MTDGTLAPAGWYPDPADARFWRWWDGGRWTVHTAPRLPLGPTMGDLRLLHAAEEQVSTGALVGVVGLAVVTAGFVLAFWGSSAYSAHLFHYFRQAIDRAGRPLPTQPIAPAWFTLTELALIVVEAAATAVFLVWVYRASRIARSLRYPAKRSPGWSVGVWFIPVVNLWMPYQSLRDLLPPGHEGRRRVLRYWLLQLFVGLLVTPTFITLAEAHSTGVALALAVVVLELGVATLGYRMVTTARDEYRRVMADHSV